MPKPQYALDYSQCLRPELQSFILRRLPRNFGNVKRAEQIVHAYPSNVLRRALIDLDSADEFTRFFELPAELRILVYKELLADQKEIHPQILRCSKQLHKEAEPILYGESDISVKIGMFSRIVGGPRYPKMKLSLPGSKFPGYSYDLVTWAPVSSLKAIRKVQKFTLKIEVVPCDRESLIFRTAVVSQRIASMCLLLCDVPQLRCVTVAVEITGGDLDDSWYQAVLSPLPLLSNGVEIKFSGLDREKATAFQKGPQLRHLKRQSRLEAAGTRLIAAREKCEMIPDVSGRRELRKALFEVATAHTFDSSNGFEEMERKLHELEELMWMDYIT